jgi:hypothetical protein
MVEQPKPPHLENATGDGPRQTSLALPERHVCAPRGMLPPITPWDRAFSSRIDEPMWKIAGISSQLNMRADAAKF